jgi:AraC family transcriptional regulator, regulatory protein of adaptative response / DNA-3-methyladenine glycosylase II
VLLFRGEDARVPIAAGLRPPGAWDPFEVAVVAVLGNGRDEATARDSAGRLVAMYGTPVPGLRALGLSHTFPAPSALAGTDLASLGIGRQRASTIGALARSVADGSVDLDRTAGYRTLARSLSVVDGFTAEMTRQVASRLGVPEAPATALLA